VADVRSGLRLTPYQELTSASNRIYSAVTATVLSFNCIFLVPPQNDVLCYTEKQNHLLFVSSSCTIRQNVFMFLKPKCGSKQYLCFWVSVVSGRGILAYKLSGVFLSTGLHHLGFSLPMSEEKCALLHIYSS
jgi:hypothetical protein